MSVLDDLGSTISQLAGTAGTSVVGIGRRTRGSGVVIADGKVLTNAHNLRYDTVNVTFAGGRAVQGRVAAVDGDGDLAVIEVDTAGSPPITWSDGTDVSIGRPVFAAAATRNGGARVTVGFVSATAQAFRGPGGRRIAGSVEHTAPLAPGSSGSALLDAEGRLVGINTNRLDEGFYLAIPADAALKTRVEALGRGEAPERLRLGVAIAPDHVARRLRRSVGLPERAGVLVRGLDEDGLAAAAGIEPGDLIVSAGGTPVADGDDLFEALGSLTTPFEVAIVRGAEERTVTIGAAKGRTPGDA
jgi:serine protease Do